MHFGSVGYCCYNDSVLADRVILLGISGGYLRSCGHRDSELDLKKHLN